MNRVVITGLGLITGLGIGLEDNFKKLFNGETGISFIEGMEEDIVPVKIAGQVKNFDPTLYGIEKKDLKKMSRNIQFAIATTKMALEDANLVINENNAEDVGVIVSSGVGGLEIAEEATKVLTTKGSKRVSPFTIPAMISNMAAGNVGIYFKAKGPNKCIVTACASGTNSIGDAFELIKHGRAKYMIAGGAEACITPVAISGFNNMKALSSSNNPNTASKPFSLDRDGFVMGEGAGILILEDMNEALKRGAKIYAEIVGYGETCDAFHMTAPMEDGEGASRAMAMAIKEAGINYDEVEYINAHGTSTPMNDKVETNAIKKLFKEHAKNLYISSTKGATGHALGAAGGIEGVILAKSIESSILPPTINLKNQDPDCDLNYVPNEAIKKDIRVGMSNSLGFGGHNAVIIMKKFEK